MVDVLCDKNAEQVRGTFGHDIRGRNTVIEQTIRYALLAMTVTIGAARAAPIDIHGQIVDTSQGSPQPVAGAWVYLATFGVGDSTDADGQYHISGDTRVLGHPTTAALSLARPVLRGSMLHFPVDAPSARVSVAIFNLLGRRAVSVLNDRLDRGVYSVNIGQYAGAGLSSSLYMVGVTVGGKSSFFKLLNVTRYSRGGADRSADLETGGVAVVAKSAAPAVDTLVVLKVATATNDTLAYSLRSIISFTGTMPDIVLCIGCDTDGDGLPDDREIHSYRTNPRQADTDGDGWNDFEELLQFSPPARFNPVIADLPSVEIVIADPPEVGLNWTSSVGSATGSEVVVGTQSTFAQSTSNSFGSSLGLEHGWTVSGEIGCKGNNFVGKVGGAVSGTYAYQSTTQWGYSSSRSNARSWERAQSMEESHEITYNDGYIAVAAYIRNNSGIGYTVNDLQLAAYKMDYNADNGFEHVSHLELEGLGSGFTVPPNQMVGPFDFSNTLSLGEARALVVESEAFMTKLSGHSISMVDDEGTVVDFTHEYTTAAARTALVRIDFGPHSARKPLMYRVATKVKYNENHAGLFDMYFPYTMRDAMRTIAVDYDTTSLDGNVGLSSVDGLAHSPDENAYWFVYHTTPEDSSLLSLRDTSYQFDSIVIDAYHTVELIYSRDRDGDGIPERTENMIGTSDSLADTDADGLTDREELVGWTADTITWKTDPLCEDTDGDGVADPDDDNPLQRPLGTSATIDVLTLVDPDHRMDLPCDSQSTTFAVVDTFRTSVCSLQIALREIAGMVSVVRYGRHDTLTIDSVACTDTRGVIYECRVPMGINANELGVTVVSEDGAVTEQYRFTDIQSPLRVPDWEVKPKSVGSFNTILVRAADYGEMVIREDSRVDGLLIVAKPFSANVNRTLAPRYQFNYSVGDTLFELDTAVVLDVTNGADIDSALHEVEHTNLRPGTRYWYTIYSFGEVDDTLFYTAAAAPKDTVTTNRVRVRPFVTDVMADYPACNDIFGCQFGITVRINGQLITSQTTGWLTHGEKEDFGDTAGSVILSSAGTSAAACLAGYSPGSPTVIEVIGEEIGVGGGSGYGPATARFVYEWPYTAALDSEGSGACAQNIVGNFTGHIYTGTTFRRFSIYCNHEYNLDKYVTIGMGFDWEYVD
ncbi:MAG: hypothetical protein GF331_24850 [Chitinivibrionales bacterium]|nr:hypothetical protein [Chitinivibrionales bacterium]